MDWTPRNTSKEVTPLRLTTPVPPPVRKITQRERRAAYLRRSGRYEEMRKEGLS